MIVLWTSEVVRHSLVGITTILGTLGLCYEKKNMAFLTLQLLCPVVIEMFQSLMGIFLLKLRSKA